MHKNGANQAKNRGLYELYNSKSVAAAATSSPKSNKINQQMAHEMDKEEQRVNGTD